MVDRSNGIEDDPKREDVPVGQETGISWKF
jgi:hypothetical protein